MSTRLIECVPNFSEGRNPATFEAIRHVIASVAGVVLLKAEMDPDHNRSVMTFAGPPDAVSEAAFRAIETSRNLIDLRTHAGVHPRIGAADVVPLVPLDNLHLEQCVELAHRLGMRVWEELQVPVYFYESAALSAGRVQLENVRRGGFRKPNLAPDLGGPALHPTAGGCIIGARRFLIAYNVNLNTTDVRIAQAIARSIRASSGGLPFVKAMGVFLETRNQAQVSINITNFEQTPIHQVFDRIQAEAAAHGVTIAGSEVIGLLPKRALETAAGHYLKIENFGSGVILENRMQDRELA